MQSEAQTAMYETWKQIRVAVMTWNLGGKVPHPSDDLSECLLPEDDSQVDVYVIGF